MISNKSFNNTGNKDKNYDLIDLISSCFFNNLFFTFLRSISNHCNSQYLRGFLWIQDLIVYLIGTFIEQYGEEFLLSHS